MDYTPPPQTPYAYVRTARSAEASLRGLDNTYAGLVSASISAQENKAEQEIGELRKRVEHIHSRLIPGLQKLQAHISELGQRADDIYRAIRRDPGYVQRMKKPEVKFIYGDDASKYVRAEYDPHQAPDSRNPLVQQITVRQLATYAVHTSGLKWQNETQTLSSVLGHDEHDDTPVTWVINDEQIRVTGSLNLAMLCESINNQAKGFRAGYVRNATNDCPLMFTATSTGVVLKPDENTTQMLKFIADDSLADRILATMDYFGVKITRTQNTFNDLFKGLILTILQPTPSPVTIVTVQSNAELADRLRDYTVAYNTAGQHLNETMKARFKNYHDVEEFLGRDELHKCRDRLQQIGMFTYAGDIKNSKAANYLACTSTINLRINESVIQQDIQEPRIDAGTNEYFCGSTQTDNPLFTIAQPYDSFVSPYNPPYTVTISDADPQSGQYTVKFVQTWDNGRSVENVSTVSGLKSIAIPSNELVQGISLTCSQPEQLTQWPVTVTFKPISGLCQTVHKICATLSYGANSNIQSSIERYKKSAGSSLDKVRELETQYTQAFQKITENANKMRISEMKHKNNESMLKAINRGFK